MELEKVYFLNKDLIHRLRPHKYCMYSFYNSWKSQWYDQWQVMVMRLRISHPS
jgi:hypothetical protein